MTETTGQVPQPQVPHGAYPPPPLQKSGRKTGLIVGGAICGVVLLAALVAVVVIVGKSGGGDDSASPDGNSAGDEANGRLPSDPCESIKSDVEALGVDGSLTGSSHTYRDGSGSGTCLGKLQKSADESAGHARFYADVYLDEKGDSAKYDEFVDEKLKGFDTSDLSGAWEKGTIGTRSTGSLEYTGVVVHDANLDIALVLNNHSDMGISDPEGVLTSLTEKLLDDLRA